MNKIPALIVAVNWSAIFPSRSLELLNSEPLLSHVVNRLRKMKYVSHIALCTSIEENDDTLVEEAIKNDIDIIRGDFSNVASRLLKAYDYYNCSEAFLARGDAPFVSFTEGDKLIKSHLDTKAEFSYNEYIYGLPYGLGGEVIAKELLFKMKELQLSDSYSQKISLFIRLNEGKFKTNKLKFKKPDSDVSFAVESYQGLDFARELFALAKENATPIMLLNTLEKHPFLKSINKPSITTKEIGLEKIVLFPEKLRSLISGNKNNSYPVSIELSLTNKCNLACRWCSDNELRGAHPGALSYDIYKNLIDDFAEHGVNGIVIEGGGEPTIYPHFNSAVEYALSKKLAVGLITNGVEFNYSQLVNQMEWIRVSLDADTPSTFKEWKGKDSFHDVLSNIRRMCELKGNCVVGVGYVVTKYNIEHIEEVTLLLREYGVDYLYLRPVIDHPEMQLSQKLTFLKKFESDAFTVMIHAMNENMITGNNGLPCKAHSLSSVISGDGAVFLCGRLNIHDEIKPIGNINESSFYDIWNGKERARQIQQVADYEFCKEWCPECRMTKYNILLSKTEKIRTRNFI